MTELTDKELLDYLNKNKTNSNGWICRDSSMGRGLRIHQTSREDAVSDIREAIKIFIEENKRG